MPNKDLIIEIKANTKQALKEIEELKREIKEFSENVKKGDIDLKRSEETLSSFTKRVTDMAHAYVGFSAVKGVINVVADFEQSIAKLGAISGASRDNLEALKQKAEELGEKTQFSASEVAEGMNYLAMAGYKTKDIMASIGDVLNLAQVGMIDLGRASDIASNILSGFGLSAKETKRVVDVMTATITNANTDIPEMGEAMKMVAPQARSLGISIEETATALGVLADNGLKGTIAGTGLSTMLLRLSAPTGAAADAINELGIKIYDANGKFVGLTNVLKQFKEKMSGMSQEMKVKYMRDIFGIETMKTALTLINSVGNSYDELYKKIANSMGISEKKAKQMTDTFKGHLKELESAFQGLIITIGEQLLPALTDFVKWLTNAIQTGEKFYKENRELINVIAELASTFYALGKAKAVFEAVLGAKAVMEIITAVKAVKTLKEAFILLYGAIAKLSKANAVLLGLSLAIEGVNYAMDKWEERIERLNSATETLNDSNKKFRSLLDELQSHMDFSNNRREIKMTADELDKMKEKVKALMLENTKRINKMTELYKKGTDNNKALEREIDVLIARNKVLMRIYTKLKHTKPFEGAEKSAKSAENEIRKLTKAEKKYIETIKKEYQKRISAHKGMIKRLKAQEKSLTDRIFELQKELNARLRNLENERILAIENIEDRIQNLQMSGASEYQKYVMIKERADKKYALAKQALEKGNFQLAKSYMSEYSSLISQIANKEIKENGRVVLTKKQANNIAIANLKKLESLTKAYYAKEKQEAINAYNNKIRLIKAQLEATREQIKLEVQRLNLEKQMIELLTGKKVTINTTAALNEIKNLDRQIKRLDAQIKHPKKIVITADTTQAKQKVNNETKQFENKKITAKVTADTTQAKQNIAGVLQVTNRLTGKTQTIKYSSNGKAIRREIKPVLEITDKLTGKTKKINLSTNAGQTKGEINGVLQITNKLTGKTHTVKIKADGREAENEINKLKKPTQSRHRVKLPNIGQVESKIKSLNNMNTSSTHTIYIREVHTKATGGLIEPLKRATGGSIEFKRQSGRIPGYDPNDSDDVPALLTRGEFVIKRDAVAHYGENFLYALNNKLLPKFATGGIVERGNPQIITQNLQNTLNDMENSDNGNDIDLSKIDDLIESLKQLAETFKKGGVEDKSNLALNLINSLKTEKEKITNQVKRIQKDENDYKTYSESLRGKTVTQKEFKNFNIVLKSKKSIVDNDNKTLDKLKTEKENLIKKTDKKIQELNEYLQKVENIKNKIDDKLSDFGIDSSEIKGLNNSLDLKRLDKFYKKIETLSLDKFKQQIKKQLENKLTVLRMEIGEKERIWVTSQGEFGSEALAREQRIIEDLGNKIRNDAYLTEEANKLLLKNIPKFQTGGLLQLQTGGKLPGYGGGDRNLALLEDGEFVIRKEAVSHFGVNLFDKLNNLKLPKFQTGGYVGSLSNIANTTRDSVDLNFNIGNKSYTLNAQRNVAEELVRELKKLM